MRPVTRTAAALLASLLTFAACDDRGDGITEDEGQLTDLEALLEGAPDPAKLPDEPKSDATYPAKFDLVALQSPVRNQASRGVCSIFSTVALMEHLYIKEGTLKTPDFSEQHLQWAVKAQVGAYITTEGSNADRNIEAIQRFGIVDEATWPYETSRWGTFNDARCTGKEQPVVCYTNGDPSDTVKAAKTWKLPQSRWVSNRRQSIKAFMAQNKQAVVAGMTFYYQAWNHGGSPLPVSGDYAKKGYILFPNDKDIETSKEKPAGHSILIVGWDDDLTVERHDEAGEVMLDADGKPMTEKGFFLIKNSWGTGKFGTENPFGAGYGWLSMKYVETYANVNGADVPRLDLGPEDCNDGVDNNYNRLTDCEDSPSCRSDAACQTAGRVFEGKPNRQIPDDSAAGLSDTLAVDTSGSITDAWVEVDIAHTFIRDVRVVVTLPSGRAVTLYDRADTGKNLRRRFLLPALVGELAAGNWTLTVSDNSKGDTGKLERWALGLTVSGGALVEVCGDGKDNDGNQQTDCADVACASEAACQSNGPGTLSGLSDHLALAIPDQDTAGVKSTIALVGAGAITNVAVEIGITHSYRGDLTIKLIAPDGTTATVLDQQGGSAKNVDARFPLSAFNGHTAAGTWTLWVVDGFAGDTGTLDVWQLDVDVK